MTALWPPRNTPNTSYISDPPSAAYCEKQVRNIVVLGSTGSIGKNALAIIEQTSRLAPLGLAAGRNIQLLAEQAANLRPPYLAVLNENLAKELAGSLPGGYSPQILYGREGYARLASFLEADCVLSAQAGSAGLIGTLAAALAGKVIALANKESLVMAGGLVRSICGQSGATILPVDSEHYAIFQCMAGHQDVASLILTASGGPFLNKSAAAIYSATPREALKHPNWSMGAKITIDSATLMNKGLEFIEAMHLYGIKPQAIRIVIHPQSIVHSLAQFADNSILGQFAVPNMRLPIAACLLWPHVRQAFVRPLNLAEIGTLTFQKPDMNTFRCLALAMQAAEFQADDNWTGINPACLVLNAANETAVELFLQGKCTFGQISEIVETVLEELVYRNLPSPGKIDQDGNPAQRAIAIADQLGRLDTAARQLAREMGI